MLTDVRTGPLQGTLGTSPDGVTHGSYSSTTSPRDPTILDEETTNYVCNIVAKKRKKPKPRRFKIKRFLKPTRRTKRDC